MREPLCFQNTVGGGVLMTSHTRMALSPSLNSWGDGALVKVIFSTKNENENENENQNENETQNEYTRVKLFGLFSSTATEQQQGKMNENKDK